MAKVADPLWKYIHGHDWSDRSTYDDLAWLVAIAGQIDAEHERRMEQCRRETKRAAMRYLNSVIVDYAKHDMKRSRADMQARYERKGRPCRT